MKRGERVGLLLITVSFILFYLGMQQIHPLFMSVPSNHSLQPPSHLTTAAVALIPKPSLVVLSPRAFIDITSERFYPEEIIIEPNTIVTWRNTWSVHVIDIYTLHGKYQSLALSKKLREGESWNFTFSEPGEYHFRDLYFGWKGAILVR